MRVDVLAVAYINLNGAVKAGGAAVEVVEEDLEPVTVLADDQVGVAVSVKI